MAGEWRTFTLGEICDFRAGSVFKPALQGKASGDFPFVKVSDMNLPANAVRIQVANNWVSCEDVTELKARPLPPGTVIFAKIGEALRQNRLRQLTRDTLIDNNMMGAIPSEDKVDPHYFYYALSQFDFADIAQGTALPYLTVAALSTLTLDVPPISEQRAIAHILGTLDDKIELNRRQNETLEAMARALFKAWFVDFEPVRAKMEGRWQRGQSLPGLPAHLYDLFPDRLVESELGEIPEGWTVRAIEDVIKRLSVGKKYDQKTVNKEGRTPVLDQGKSGILGYHNDEPGVVATVDNPVVVFANHTCLMRLISYPFSAIQNVLPFIGKGISTIWVFYASIGKQSFVEYKGHWPDFVQHKVVVPPVNLAEIFSAYVHGYLRAIWQNEAESRPLIHLHDTLLPKLISGELRVPDVDRFMEAMA